MTLKKKYILMSSIVAFVLICDLVTKAIFGDIEFTKIIPFLIDFESNHGNDGAAFGMFGGKKILLILIALFFLGVMFLVDWLFKYNSKTYIFGFSFMVGGALGNLIDRIFLGYVRDFIVFDFWKSFPTFNVADSFLCVGVVLICICLIFGKSKGSKVK